MVEFKPPALQLMQKTKSCICKKIFLGGGGCIGNGNRYTILTGSPVIREEKDNWAYQYWLKVSYINRRVESFTISTINFSIHGSYKRFVLICSIGSIMRYILRL